jgi:hypothetical protein
VFDRAKALEARDGSPQGWLGSNGVDLDSDIYETCCEVNGLCDLLYALSSLLP